MATEWHVGRSGGESFIEVDSGRLGYLDVVEFVVKNGRRRAARGLPTLDAGHVTIVSHDPSDSLPVGVGRGVNGRIAAAEAVQLIGRFSSPDLMTRVSHGSFDRFREPDSGRFHGAYGERIRDQLSAALRKVSVDPDTRQAVVTLWDPLLDNLPNKRDFPCTVSLGFQLDFHPDGDFLHLNVQMRSSDVWLGLPYDLFQFSELQQTAARVLGVSVGRYRHTTWSLHVYERDLDKTTTLRVAEPDATPPRPRGIGRPGDTAFDVVTRARLLAHGTLDAFPTLGPVTDGELWYLDQLRPENAS